MTDVLRSIIIDDEPLAHKVIQQYAADIPFVEITGQSYLATDAYTILQEKEIDLIFLDINMPKLKGLDFLRTLDKPPKIIITSAYEEYALEGYELQVSDYLLKPFRFDRFLRAVNKVRTEIKVLKNPKEEIKSDDKNLFVKVDRKFIQISFDEIYFIESYGNYVKIWVNDKFHLTPRTLSSFSSELNNAFIQIHKSFIINRAYINYVEGNLIFMKNKREVPIGKSYKKTIKDWLKQN